MTVPTHPPMLGSGVARLRRWYWLHVRRWKGELCQYCGGRYYPVVWRADDALFGDVGGGVGLVCPACFSRLARKLGLSLHWHPVAEWRWHEGKQEWLPWDDCPVPDLTPMTNDDGR